MKYGSVCSGIEAASVAWEPLGLTPAWFSQFDPEHNYKKGPDFPSTVLAHHWPHVSNLGDMTKLAAMVRSGEVEAPDILVGGTPCQAFSVAGARKGLEDARGQLTISYGELADAIDEQRISEGKQPSIIVWENVPGVLSSKDNAFGAFLGLLAGEDCELEPPGEKWSNAGYVSGPKRSIAWRILDAQYFGVAQRRRRVFVVASARADFNPGKILFESDGLRRDIAPGRNQRKVTPSDAGESFKNGSHWDGPENPHPTLNQSNNTGGIGASNQELFSQRGSGIVGAYRMTAFGEYADDDSASTVKARDYKDATDLAVMSVHGTQDPNVNTELAHALGRNNGGENAILSFSSKDNGQDASLEISPTLRAGGHHTSHANAGCPPAIAYCLQHAQIGRKNEAGPQGKGWQEEVGFTLDSRSVADAVTANFAVRRLTPIECERLQGFPDNHTAIPWKGKDAEDCPDGQRYKAIGNSMAVPVMAWIGKRIISHLNK
ncbi:DNA cytosine methyltransferase [Pantoea ananatis]|nr:DNA cytosine methyltransferase [Pantoea ananatis]MDN4131864.1 DNA cytosine methyltransferase [Pantoea ananatis]